MCNKDSVEIIGKYKSQIDAGIGLWYIVSEHTNQRWKCDPDGAIIYDDLETALAFAAKLAELGSDTFVPISIFEYNSKYAKHMEEGI